MSFSGKVVLITGASSRFIIETARRLAKQGAILVLVYENKKEMEVPMYIERDKCHTQPLKIIADVTDDSAIEDVVKKTIENFNKIDVLINAAGVIKKGGIKKSKVDTYDKIMAVNMRAVFKMTKLATPHLVESKGCIVNISSILGSKVTTNSIAYSVSKAALDQFTKCVALELAPDGVRVNSVSPCYREHGLIKYIVLKQLREERRDWIEALMDEDEDDGASLTSFQKRTEVEEIANLIVFLASDKAKSITGSCVTIDAGLSLK